MTNESSKYTFHDLRDTVYLSELVKKAKVFQSTIYSWDSYKTKRMIEVGKFKFIKKSELPGTTKDKYLKVWDDCTVMDDLYPLEGFLNIMNVYLSYFHHQVKRKTISVEITKIGALNFIRIPPKVLEHLRDLDVVHILPQLTYNKAIADEDNGGYEEIWQDKKTKLYFGRY